MSENIIAGISDRIKERPLEFALTRELIRQEIENGKPLNSTKLVEAIISAYLKDIWKTFDPKDKSTWPKSLNAPSGEPWLTKRKDTRGLYGDMFTKSDNNPGYWLSFQGDHRITHYCDPADILPENG